MRNEKFSIVFSAPSGAGKTTLIQRLVAGDDMFEFSISTTTRRPRPDEKEGVHYYFVDETEFERMKAGDEFIEWAVVHKNNYGTTKKEVDRIKVTGKIPVFDVDVQGARTLKAVLSEAVFIFIVPPSLEVLKSRLRARDTESKEQIEIRIENALNEITEYVRYDYVVINDTVNEALSEIRSIIRAENCRSSRMNNTLLTRGIVNDNTAG